MSNDYVPDYGLPTRIWKKVEPVTESGCWLWTGAVDKHKGHGRTYWKEKVQLSHRVFFEAKHGKIPDGMCVCHKCDVPSCVNPDHLFVGTVADNNADMRRKGRASGNRTNGERHHRAKFTDEQAIKIRSDPRGSSEIAREYGVHHSTIFYLKSGKNWKHLRRANV